MSLASRLQRLIPDLSNTVARFPGAVLVSLTLTVLVNLDIASESLFEAETFERLLRANLAAFAAAGAGHLYAEGRRWPQGWGFATSIAAALVAAAMFWFAHPIELRMEYFAAGLVLLLMTAAYIRPDARQGALWLFNFRLLFSALVAAVVTVATCGGLSAIVASLHFLFDFPVSSDTYSHIWATGASLIAPLYGMSLISPDLDEEFDATRHGDPIISHGVSVLSNYILVPLALVYVVILHAYALKIVLTGELPKGMVANLVCLFGLGGTAIYLIAYPWRDTGTRLLRWYLRSWFWFTIVPVVLLTVAVWRRVSDYGLTPERYGLIIIAVWLAAMAAYLAWKRGRADLRVIMLSLAGLLLLGSVGPWGAQGASITSQFGRLETLLARLGYLKDERLVSPRPTNIAAGSGDANSVGSIIWFLINEKADDRLRPWFEGHPADPWKSADRSNLGTKLSELLGVPVAPDPKLYSRYVSFSATEPHVFSLPANSVLSGPVRLSPVGAPESVPKPGDPMTVNRGATIDIVYGTRVWTVTTLDLVKQLDDKSAPAVRSLVVDGPAGQLTIIVEAAYGEDKDDTTVLNSGTFWLILPQ
ncbi:MAG TPA: DUF4153 domain-containing protein [Aestuariivirgaceae bacterium]|nr:DUF4153 domain-containing protein [Aestuariivirgaceae bacterium]